MQPRLSALYWDDPGWYATLFLACGVLLLPPPLPGLDVASEVLGSLNLLSLPPVVALPTGREVASELR